MLKKLVLHMLGKAGYTLLRTPQFMELSKRVDRLSTNGDSASGDEADHQRDSREYHIRTGMGDMDKAFLPIYEQCRRFSMTSADRMFALYKSVEYLERAGVRGDIVECGVWRGGSMMLVAHTLLALKNTSRHLHLFDTFEGLPKPDESKDVDVWGNKAIDGWRPNAKSDNSSTWALASLEEVQENFRTTGYPCNQVHYVKGMVEETIPRNAPESIALLRLDTDWYASTKHELEHLFPKLRPDGVLIIDDYGHFKGARQAVDEYIQKHNLPILLNRVDYTGRVAIKNFTVP